jgi:restriction system protein
MTIPDFQTIMLPLLKFAADRKEHHIHDAIENLSQHFLLTSEEKTTLLPSAQQYVFDNRVGWARTYLKKAGLLIDPRRGYFNISDRGIKVINDNPKRIDRNYLKQFPEYLEFRATRRNNDAADDEIVLDDLDPDEVLENAYQNLRNELADELIKYVNKGDSSFFEKLVVELLVKMGYGGSHQNAARAIGQSGDEGIDGIIDEDRLGLDSIYIQAKKWSRDSHVGRPEVQRFVGALQGKRAKKGIFITTSQFTTDAQNYVKNIDVKVVLIDGSDLANLMIDYGVGVSKKSYYEIKTIDTDFFNYISLDD